MIELFVNISAYRHNEVKLVRDPPYLKLAFYEKNFQLDYWRETLWENSRFTLYASIVYVVLIFGIQAFMKNRPAYNLNKQFAAWNFGVAAMSVYAFCRISPEFFHVLFAKDGFHNSVCYWKAHNGATAFWTFILAISKFFEFGDTAFVVLRKQRLQFIHWFHHALTLMTFWPMYYPYEPIQQWYYVMNSFVHSCMYTYFGFKALQYKLPKQLARLITRIQLTQMILSFIANSYSMYVLFYKGALETCPHRNVDAAKCHFIVACIFLYLFGKLYIENYYLKPRAAAAAALKKKE